MMRSHILFILALTLVSCSEKPRFELLDPDRTGITFANRVVESDSLNVMNFEYIYNGAGVGIADLDNDGRQDLVFTGNQVSPRVYLNKGKFRFRDISSGFRDLDNGQWYSGVTFVDINLDGWNDLYLTCTAYDDSLKRKNRLFINRGIQEDGQLDFEDMAEAYGIADDSYTVQAAFFDYDLDGDLDLFLLNNYVNARLSADYRPKITDGSAPSNDDLYRNNGDGTFSNVTIEAGIVYEGFSLGLAVGDLNKDGYPDIYVSNDYISNDLLYINQGDGTFQNLIDDYLSYQTFSSMGNDMADINNDGNPEIFTLDMMPEDYHRKKQTINGFGYIYYEKDATYGYEHQYLRNMLHLHNGFVNGEMAPFSEIGQMMGIYQTEWSWAPLFADFDNDGDKDLLVTNGYPRDMTYKDWINYRFTVGPSASPMDLISKLPAVRVPNYAFENQGTLNLKRNVKDWFEEIPSYSYGAAFADLDNDGDLDYVVNNLNEEAFVYRNRTVEDAEGESHFLRISLNGNDHNPSGVGAKIELWCDSDYQYQEHFLARGYASSVDPVIHFGLGDHARVDSVKVTWPAGGRISFLEDIRANQMVQIEEMDAVASDQRGLHTEDFESLFSRDDSVLDYKHVQTDFVDFQYSQLTIPHKFSQIGPCIRKGDLNNDGLDDLVTGATNVLPTRVFLRDGNRYRETGMPGLTQSKACTESDLSIIDVDLDGDNDVIGLAGGYENPEEAYVHYLYENNNGSFSRSKLPTAPFPASVVRPFDFDHDGDPDLFIGARIGMEIFPFSANSWILINEKGTYSPERALNFYLGMVTDAAWSDIDGDGWEDLLITREWNSMAVIRNLEGERFQIQEIPEIEARHGIWYSITAADFDLDGDDDYILGNLGENHRFTVSDQYPLRIYALDTDLNGTLDPIITGYWRDREGVLREYPVHYMDELMGQAPVLLRKYNDYSSYSYATIGDILDPEMMNRVDYRLMTTTTSSYILWNHNGTFDWERLPDPAQVSPVKHTIVEDFNHDGIPDLILAGNDHTYNVSTGYLDAGKGLVMLSRDGRPFGDVRMPSRSGLLLNGMVESLLYMDGEAPHIIAGINRAGVQVFSLTATAGD